MSNPGNIAFGTWKIPVKQAATVIAEAILAGFRHIDTAAAYANEAGVGEGIAASGVPHDALFVSGKLWTTRRAYDAAIKACKRSLMNLHLAYFDQYLVHWPTPPSMYADWRERNAETWCAMETLYRDGLVRSIGVCNCKPHHLEALMQTATVMPMVNQIECHPGYYPLETIVFCEDHGIRVEAWSPLGNGTLLTHPVLQKIAEAHGRNTAQVCLCWCTQHDVLPVTKTVSPERMRSNLATLDFVLSEKEMQEIDALPTYGYSGLDPDTLTQFR